MNKNVSIIIPVYNNELELKYTLDSILNSNYDLNLIEVLICDDGSSIDFTKLLKSYNLKIKYFFQEDLGFRAAKARNIGIKNAKYDICLFIDSGLVISKNCLHEMVKFHESNSKYAIIGYVYGFSNTNDFDDLITKNLDFDNIDQSIEKMEQLKIYDRRETGYQLNGDDLEKWIAPWCYVTAGLLSVLKSELNLVGGFDESFTEWGVEDADLGISLFKNNVKIKLNRMAKSIHIPHPKRHEFSSNFDEFIQRLKRQRKYLYEKHELYEVYIWSEIELNSDKLEGYLQANKGE